MKKYIVPIQTAAYLLLCCSAFSQKGIKGLINAEKAFASFTASHTIREGFLQYMDSAGVIFRQGYAVNALDTYQKQKPGTAILSWEPEFAVISASGDIGVTTGPYKIRPQTLPDTTVGRGSFSSVWQINKKGEWKNLADLGTSYSSPYPAVRKVKGISLPKTKNVNSTYDEVWQIDKKFNMAVQEKNTAILTSHISTDSWLNIDGQVPVVGAKQIQTALQNIPDGLILISQAGYLSSAKDLVYIYGTVINGLKKENYLRVWIYRNKQWQVILQTIKW